MTDRLPHALRSDARDNRELILKAARAVFAADGLNVPTVADHPDPEYILWVGCAGAFDARIITRPKVVRAIRPFNGRRVAEAIEVREGDEIDVGTTRIVVTSVRAG